ncbi:MAG: thaumatin family protein [Polyangiaceae bacterium]
MRIGSLALPAVACAVLSACGSGGSSPASPSMGGGQDASGVSQPSDAAGGEGSVEMSTPDVSSSPVVDAAATTTPDAAGTGPVDAALIPPPTDAALLGPTGLPRTFTVVNRCTQTVWAAALPATTFPGGLVEMAPGYAFQVGVDNGWSGRIWGKTNCTTSGTTTTCASSGFPASLAELTLTKTATGLDFYDVSLVDGFNLPIALEAVGHTPDPAHPYSCGSPTCAANLDTTCSAQFQDKDKATGQVLACANDACKVIGNNVADASACVYPNQYTEFFKTACPQAYSFPYDDPTSTFTCKGFNSYAVVFCP